MLAPLEGHENCRGRPPNKGDCREGPDQRMSFEIQQAKFGIRGPFLFYGACDAPQHLRQRTESASEQRSANSSQQYIFPENRDPARVTHPHRGRMTNNIWVLCPERKLPPWKPVLSCARDWVDITCSGEFTREPDRLNHTSSSPQKLTAAKKRHRWGMSFFEPFINKTK